MDPIVGCIGLQNLSQETLLWYLDFFKEIDHLNISPQYFTETGDLKDESNNLIVADLGSIVDVNLINIYLRKETDSINIIEVGGGYGRLAEVFFNVAASEKSTINKVKYVLVDAVPATLMYAYKYLVKALPNIKIGFYYNGDDFNLDKFDCYIAPSWYIEKINNSSYDLAINVQSMQEMEQFHVDFYLKFFDKILNNNGRN